MSRATERKSLVIIFVAFQACSGTSTTSPPPDFSSVPPPVDKGIALQDTAGWVCGSPACGGCCTVSNSCATGVEDTTCGKGGGPCVDCTATGRVCNDGFCGEQQCVPACDGKACGDADGCGGKCQVNCPTTGCTDGVKNDSETAIDCGGGTCPPCANGLDCMGGPDCASGVCTNNKCTKCVDDTTCLDGTFCNEEICAGKGAAGEPCASGLECATGFCANSVCCDKVCDGTCEACSVATGATTNGTCAFLPATMVCREADGFCDVAETCTGTEPNCPANAFAPTTKTCDDANICSHTDRCNGAGVCAGTAINCPDTACHDRACNGSDLCTVQRKTTGTTCASNKVCSPTGQCCRYVCDKDGCRYTSCTAG